MFTNFELGPFLSSASSKHAESRIGILVRPAKGSELPRQVADAAGSPLSLDDLRTWFAPVSNLQWKARKVDALKPILNDVEFVAEQNGLVLTLVLPVGRERNEDAAENEIRGWIRENLA